MKKTNSLYIVIIVLLCVVALLLAGVLGVSLFYHRFKALPEKTVDNAPYTQVVDETYENAYDAIEVSSNYGNIFVLNSDDAQLHLKIWADEKRVTVTEAGKHLSIVADARETKGININNVNSEQVRIELYLPADYDKELRLKTDYGSAETESFPSLQLEAESAYGSLTLDEVATLKAEYDCGSIRADKINESVSAECEMGNVEIEELAITADSEITCEMGNIEIQSAPTARVEADTNLGSVNVRPDPDDATIRLVLENNAGNITVK